MPNPLERETNKDLPIDFLDQLLPQYQIDQLSFKTLKTCRKPLMSVNRFSTLIAKMRSANVLLLKCKKRKCSFFKDRSLSYSMFTVREQGKKGEKSFDIATTTDITKLTVMEIEGLT